LQEPGFRKFLRALGSEIRTDKASVKVIEGFDARKMRRS
jgi:hypothetical protein